MNHTWEKLSETLWLCVSKSHKFGTDAFLLSNFAAPRRKDRVCDLCAGCGIVGALWFRRTQDCPAQVTAVEIASEAVTQMRATVEKGFLPAERFRVVQGDLCDPHLLQGEVFDVITCNPPYKKAAMGILSVSDADKAARHETLCTLEDVCRTSARLLRFGGRFCMCIRPERLGEACVTMTKAGLEPKRLRLVSQRPETAPWLVLLEGRKGGKPHMTVEPTLLIEGEGGFSREVLDIYQKKHNKTAQISGEPVLAADEGKG